MSKDETVEYKGVYKGGYIHFGPAILHTFRTETEIMQNVERVEVLHDTVLYMFDVEKPSDLPISAQEYLDAKVKKLVPVGGHDE